MEIPQKEYESLMDHGMLCHLLEQVQSRSLAMFVAVRSISGGISMRWNNGGLNNYDILGNMYNQLVQRILNDADSHLSGRAIDTKDLKSLEISPEGIDDDFKTLDDVVKGLLDKSETAIIAIYRQSGSKGAEGLTCYKGNPYEAVGMATHLRAVIVENLRREEEAKKK